MIRAKDFIKIVLMVISLLSIVQQTVQPLPKIRFRRSSSKNDITYPASQEYIAQKPKIYKKKALEEIENFKSDWKQYSNPKTSDEQQKKQKILSCATHLMNLWEQNVKNLKDFTFDGRENFEKVALHIGSLVFNSQLSNNHESISQQLIDLNLISQANEFIPGLKTALTNYKIE